MSPGQVARPGPGGAVEMTAEGSRDCGEKDPTLWAALGRSPMPRAGWVGLDWMH